MDIIQITTAMGAIKGAVELVKIIKSGMSPMPDVVAARLSELNEKILTAQVAVMEVNEVILKKTEEVRKLRESLSQKNSYTLVGLRDGKFVYRYNVPPVGSDGINPVPAHAPHHICQHCLDKEGIKSVLWKGDGFLLCRVCHTKYFF